MAKPTKVTSAQPKTTKVWNLSDDPRTKVEPQTIMMFGRAVAPGRSVEVSKEVVKNMEGRLSQMTDVIHVGEKAPDDYIAALGRKKIKLPSAHRRSHGPGTAPAAPKTQKVEKVVEEKLSTPAEELSTEELEKLTDPDSKSSRRKSGR